MLSNYRWVSYGTLIYLITIYSKIIFSRFSIFGASSFSRQLRSLPTPRGIHTRHRTRVHCIAQGPPSLILGTRRLWPIRIAKVIIGQRSNSTNIMYQVGIVWRQDRCTNAYGMPSGATPVVLPSWTQMEKLSHSWTKSSIVEMAWNIYKFITVS